MLNILGDNIRYFWKQKDYFFKRRIRAANGRKGFAFVARKV